MPVYEKHTKYFLWAPYVPNEIWHNGTDGSMGQLFFAGKKYSDSIQKTAYLIDLTKQQAVDEQKLFKL